MVIKVAVVPCEHFDGGNVYWPVVGCRNALDVLGVVCGWGGNVYWPVVGCRNALDVLGVVCGWGGKVYWPVVGCRNALDVLGVVCGWGGCACVCGWVDAGIVTDGGCVVVGNCCCCPCGGCGSPGYVTDPAVATAKAVNAAVELDLCK